jgi:hypothetical protein
MLYSTELFLLRNNRIAIDIDRLEIIYKLLPDGEEKNDLRNTIDLYLEELEGLKNKNEE